MNSNKLRCNVIMLPTEKATSLGLNKESKKLYTTEMAVSHEGQHLYFVSDRKITLNDWVININRKEVFKAINDTQVEYANKFKEDFKVEATTDVFLSKVDTLSSVKYHSSLMIPKISQSFIESYIKAQGNIPEIYLEITFEAYANGDTPSPTVVRTNTDGTAVINNQELKIATNAFNSKAGALQIMYTLAECGVLKQSIGNIAAGFKDGDKEGVKVFNDAVKEIQDCIIMFTNYIQDEGKIIG